MIVVGMQGSVRARNNSGLGAGIMTPMVLVLVVGSREVMEGYLVDGGWGGGGGGYCCLTFVGWRCW